MTGAAANADAGSLRAAPICVRKRTHACFENAEMFESRHFVAEIAVILQTGMARILQHLRKWDAIAKTSP